MPHTHNQATPAVTLSVRIAPEFRDQLEELALATGRSKSFLAAEAIESYLAAHAWQVQLIEQAVAKADSKEAKFIDHEQVSDWLNSWGDDQEQGQPK